MFSNSHLLSLTSNKQQTLLHPQLHFSWHLRPLVNLSPAPVLGFLGGWAKEPNNWSGMVIVMALEASINGRSLFAIRLKLNCKSSSNYIPASQEKHKHLSIEFTCALPPLLPMAARNRTPPELTLAPVLRPLGEHKLVTLCVRCC